MSDKIKDIRLVVETEVRNRWTAGDTILLILCGIAFYCLMTGVK